MKKVNLDFTPSYCVVNHSGGKDSTLILALIVEMFGDTCEVIAHHQYLPETWEGTIEYCQQTCDKLGVKLVIEQAQYYSYRCWVCGHKWVNSNQNDLCGGKKGCGQKTGVFAGEIRGLYDLMKWREMWPSPDIRWCTAYLKREVFDKWARKNKDLLGSAPITILGERWRESVGRSKLPFIRKRPKLEWLTEYRPILDYKRIEVFQGLEDRGIQPHYCYELQGLTKYQMLNEDVEGGPRCSCVSCIYLTEQHVAYNLALPQHHELAGNLITLEDNTGHTFHQGKGIENILLEFQPGLVINRVCLGRNKKVEVKYA